MDSELSGHPSPVAPPGAGPVEGGRVPDTRVHAAPHLGRWAGIAVVLVLVAMFISTVFRNPNFHWDVVLRYVHDSRILSGVLLTLKLTVITFALGTFLGIVLAVSRTSRSWLLRTISWVYLWFFMGTPVLVQLILWYSLASLYPVIGFGIPFGPAFVEFEANDLVTPMFAAILGLGLNQSAYLGEIIRSGILSVDEGQRDAAVALGLTNSQTMRKIVLPQSVRIILPPATSQLIGLLKYTSLVSVLAIPELLYSAELIYSDNFVTIPVLLAATLWYLFITTILTIAQHYLERHFGRGTTRTARVTLRDRVRVPGAMSIRQRRV